MSESACQGYIMDRFSWNRNRRATDGLNTLIRLFRKWPNSSGHLITSLRNAECHCFAVCLQKREGLRRYCRCDSEYWSGVVQPRFVCSMTTRYLKVKDKNFRGALFKFDSRLVGHRKAILMHDNLLFLSCFPLAINFVDGITSRFLRSKKYDHC